MLSAILAFAFTTQLELCITVYGWHHFIYIHLLPHCADGVHDWGVESLRVGPTPSTHWHTTQSTSNHHCRTQKRAVAGVPETIWSGSHYRVLWLHWGQLWYHQHWQQARIVKPGSVGALPLFVPSLQNVTILKLHPETGDYLKDENGFCVECGVSEPGETVCEIT